jgi:hypothetical protein
LYREPVSEIVCTECAESSTINKLPTDTVATIDEVCIYAEPQRRIKI